MWSILQTELFLICSCLGKLHTLEPSLPLELLNHFLHSCDAGGTRQGALQSRVGLLVVHPPVIGSMGPDLGAVKLCAKMLVRLDRV